MTSIYSSVRINYQVYSKHSTLYLRIILGREYPSPAIVQTDHVLCIVT